MALLAIKITVTNKIFVDDFQNPKVIEEKLVVLQKALI